MKRTVLIIAACAVAFGDNPAQLQKKAQGVINQWVKNTYRGWVAAQEWGPGQESHAKDIEGCPGEVTLLDIDRDGDLDAVVQLTCGLPVGAGNSFRCDLAVFRNDKGSFHYLAFAEFGGKYGRIFDAKKMSMSGDTLLVPCIKEWNSDVKSVARYTLEYIDIGQSTGYRLDESTPEASE